MKGILFLALIILVHISLAQEIPLERKFGLEARKQIYQIDKNISYSLKPIHPQFQKITDSADFYSNTNSLNQGIQNNRKRSWISRKLFYEDLVDVQSGDFSFQLNPLFYLEYGLENDENETFFRNTRGVNLQGNWKNRLTFTSSFYENQAEFPAYVRNFIDSNSVVPGEGRVKVNKKVYDFAMASARLSYIINKNIMISTGQDKHFIGEGYRSILLSDNSFNYPFLSFNFNTFSRKLHYSVIYSSLQNLDRIAGFKNNEDIFERKTAVYNYMEYIFNPKIRLGLFESTVSYDALAKQTYHSRNSADYTFLSPLIFSRSIIYGKSDSLNQSNQGVNLSFQAMPSLLFYGQLATKDFDFSSLAYQFGVMYNGIKGLTVQLEKNQSTIGLYGNPASRADYNHYNQYMALPYGNNSTEYVLLLNYQYKRLLADFKYNMLKVDGSSLSIYKYIDEVDFVDFSMGFLVNPATNMQLKAGLISRIPTSNQFQPTGNSPLSYVPTQSSNYFYLSFQTTLINRYRDF